MVSYVLTMLNKGFTKNNADYYNKPENRIYGVLMDITDQPTYTCRVDTITHICSIVNSESACRLMILTLFLNDNFQKTAVTISRIHIWIDIQIPDFMSKFQIH